MNCFSPRISMQKLSPPSPESESFCLSRELNSSEKALKTLLTLRGFSKSEFATIPGRRYSVGAMLASAISMSMAFGYSLLSCSAAAIAPLCVISRQLISKEFFERMFSTNFSRTRYERMSQFSSLFCATQWRSSFSRRLSSALLRLKFTARFILKLLLRTAEQSSSLRPRQMPYLLRAYIPLSAQHTVSTSSQKSSD